MKNNFSKIITWYEKHFDKITQYENYLDKIITQYEKHFYKITWYE